MNSTATHAHDDELRASRQDGRYPRPQLLRPRWADLSGPWEFAFDDHDLGLAEGWFSEPRFSSTITVPFPFESPASGIHDPGFHPVVWYARKVNRDELDAAGLDASAAAAGLRLILHFGAVDYRARVWLNGTYLGSHEGGHTPFSFDVTDAIDASADAQSLVVRAEDDPLDVSQPRGKQDWLEEPHSIWYHRTSGIWQPVWLEAVDASAIALLHFTPKIAEGTVLTRIDLARRPAPGTTVSIRLHHEGSPVGDVSFSARATSSTVSIPLPGQSNGQAYEQLLWSPEHPRLIDATVTVQIDGVEVDRVHSYLGLRSAVTANGRFVLNDRPYYVRSVLNQGYWPESHLASPNEGALRREVELIKELGFNATRVHQKIEDPRFFFWADRLGLLVWAEAPGAFEFGALAVARTVAEWTAAVERDLSHPSIVTWVPLNESWGVQHIAHDAAMREYARALVALTRALDGSRPVISNDGWEHVDSDILTIHDYDAAHDVLLARYLDDEARGRLLNDIGPAGRPILLEGQLDAGRAVMLTEFGGISFATRYTDDDAWGYSRATTAEDFLERVDAVVSAVAASSFLAGFCYTQLADTLQETNGLLSDDRMPKAPIEALRAIIARG